jgi:hypothetical protein
MIELHYTKIGIQIMEFIKKNLSKLITAILLSLIGLLCLIAGSIMHIDSATTTKTIEGLLYVLGVPIIIVSTIILLISLINAFITTNEQSFSLGAISSGAALAAGIFIIASNDSATLIYSFISYVPYFLMVEGAILFIDSIFNFYFGYVTKKNKPALYAFITEITTAITALVIGIISISFISKEIQLIIFGGLLILYALFLVLGTLSILPTERNIANASIPDEKLEEVEEIEEIEEDDL